LEDLSNSKASALGIDWCISSAEARMRTQNRITLQGNFDPNHLFKPIPEIQKEVNQMIQDFGVHRYIVNLGHGILPQVPIEHAQAFVESVKNYSSLK
jgi:uroporphyrinogen decarboxylase